MSARTWKNSRKTSTFSDSGLRAAEFHTPVMGPETAGRVVNDPNGIYVDGTVGGGGHAEHMLARMGQRGRLIGLDRDPEAIAAASSRLRRFSEQVEFVRTPFSELPRVLDDLGVKRISGALFDLGVSSHQIDAPSRGFSYLRNGPLDMRMGPDAFRSARGGREYLSPQRIDSDIQGIRRGARGRSDCAGNMPSAGPETG